jgi:hypothetical protein
MLVRLYAADKGFLMLYKIFMVIPTIAPGIVPKVYEAATVPKESSHRGR